MLTSFPDISAFNSIRFCGQKHTKTRPNTLVFLVSIFGNYTGLPKQSDFRNPKQNIPKYSVFFFCKRQNIFLKIYRSPKLLPERMGLVHIRFGLRVQNLTTIGVLGKTQIRARLMGLLYASNICFSVEQYSPLNDFYHIISNTYSYSQQQKL